MQESKASAHEYVTAHVPDDALKATAQKELDEFLTKRGPWNKVEFPEYKDSSCMVAWWRSRAPTKVLHILAVRVLSVSMSAGVGTLVCARFVGRGRSSWVRLRGFFLCFLFRFVAVLSVFLVVVFVWWASWWVGGCAGERACGRVFWPVGGGGGEAFGGRVGLSGWVFVGGCVVFARVGGWVCGSLVVVWLGGCAVYGVCGGGFGCALCSRCVRVVFALCSRCVRAVFALCLRCGRAVFALGGRARAFVRKLWHLRWQRCPGP